MVNAQFDNGQWPYNPDAEPNGFIGITDVLELLQFYGADFNVATLSTDSSSALIFIGASNYWNCGHSCKQLGRAWDILDGEALFTHADTVLGSAADASTYAWLKSDVSSAVLATVKTGGSDVGRVYVGNASDAHHCYCSAKVHPEIEYMIVGGGSAQVTAQVNSKIAEGWFPLGNVVAPSTLVFYQTLWRYSE